MAEELKTNAPEEASQKNSAKPEKKKAKKPGIFKRIAAFFREYRSEMKKITWYPRDRVLRDTGIVVAALAVCGLAIGLMDLLFSWLIIGL